MRNLKDRDGVIMDTYTDQEWELLHIMRLQELVKTVAALGITVGDPKEYWKDHTTENTIAWTETRKKVMNAPYNTLPLYINDKKGGNDIIARWRLKVGQ